MLTEALDMSERHLLKRPTISPTMMPIDIALMVDGKYSFLNEREKLDIKPPFFMTIFKKV